MSNQEHRRFFNADFLIILRYRTHLDFTRLQILFKSFDKYFKKFRNGVLSIATKKNELDLLLIDSNELVMITSLHDSIQAIAT